MARGAAGGNCGGRRGAGAGSGVRARGPRGAGARPPRAEAVAARMAALQTLLEAFEATEPVVASGPSRREEALRPASGRGRAEKESR